MFSRFRQRNHDLEHIDKGDYSPEEFEGCMVELRRVNRWLGDARALRGSLLAEIEEAGLENFSLIDVGAGSGELLRVAANWLRRKNSRRKGSGEKKGGARFVGVELNARAAREIGEQSRDLGEISAVRGDALHLSFAEATFDYAICSLFTHHFKDRQVVAVLRELSRVARRRIFVIDLHRHPFAYYFYTTVGRLFLHNRLIREDGALSILRSFKPDELANLANQAGLEDIKVVRTFPYRLVLSARKTGATTRAAYGVETFRPVEVRS
jgi:ubiquinone/menaquinone biosynthesis C-methylase UbiE